jgi:hypothetical protein
VAAYSLPWAIGAVALRRWLSGRRGARLVFVNAVLRAAALGLIACLALASLLDPVGSAVPPLAPPATPPAAAPPLVTPSGPGAWAGLAAFFAGAVIWGPWTSLSMAVFQDACPPAALAQVIAARSSLLILASPLGTALGGPIVAALGARGTLLASALATIALGLLTAAVLARARTRTAAARQPRTTRKPRTIRKPDTGG